jgi:hypothetical protein
VAGGSRRDDVSVETGGNGGILGLWSTSAVLRHQGGGEKVRRGVNQGIKMCVAVFIVNGGDGGSSKSGGGNGGSTAGLTGS